MAETRNVVATVVKLDAETVQEAADILAAGGGDHVKLLVINGICVGLDTSEKKRLPPPISTPTLKAMVVLPDKSISQKKIEPKARRTRRPRTTEDGKPYIPLHHPGNVDVSEENIMRIIREHGAISSREIGDILGFERSNSSARNHWVTGGLKRMRDDGRVIRTGTMSEGGPLYSLSEKASSG